MMCCWHVWIQIKSDTNKLVQEIGWAGLEEEEGYKTW